MILRHIGLKIITLFLFALLILSLSIIGCGETSYTYNRVDLTWEAPNTNADGSTPLTDLTNYRIYYGTMSRYSIPSDSHPYPFTIPVGNQNNYIVNDLRSGRSYYFALKAGDSSGNWSDFSNEVSLLID